MNWLSYRVRLYNLISEMSADEQKAFLEELEGRQAKKKRKHPRKECLLTVNYATEGRAYQNFIQDISTAGAFIETREPFSVSDEILLTISYSNEQRPFKITAEVVRTSPEGVGVKFKKLSQTQEEFINSIIEKTGKRKK